MALEYACLSVLPILNSSLIRSYIIILASTAIPTPNTKAAKPGSVSTPEIKLKATSVRYIYVVNAMMATSPGNL